MKSKKAIGLISIFFSFTIVANDNFSQKTENVLGAVAHISLEKGIAEIESNVQKDDQETLKKRVSNRCDDRSRYSRRS